VESRVKPLTRALLPTLVGTWLTTRIYQSFRHPADSSWFNRFGLIALAGVMFFGAFQSYRGVSQPEAAAEPLTRTESGLFKAGGAILILSGMILLGVSSWLAWDEWISVARWPRANAVLISKDISNVGARLVFQYEIGGLRVTGVGFRWGSKLTMRNALESYEPGTVQTISYDPQDPGEVEPILGDSWGLFKAPAVLAAFSILLIAAGIGDYRYSTRKLPRAGTTVS
jgi:hypothetical protein